MGRYDHRHQMSIATKTGDAGTTGLMYNRRVPKSDPRIEACGTIDELNSALGLARALVADPSVDSTLVPIQNDLIVIMGELATRPDDLERYVKDGFSRVSEDLSLKLDRVVEQIENRSVSFRGWATPGQTPGGAALDVARSVCRRAERRVCELQASGQVSNGAILVYLNRLSDALWLLARDLEGQKKPVAEQK